MKKLLKFMLMPMLVGTPAMSVVACANSNTQVSPDQILNIAKGRMISGTFKMKGDAGDVYKLNLTDLPADNTEYNNLSADNKNTITQYFKNLVTTGSGSTAGDWEYPSVDVSISEIVGQNFITKYNSKVQSKITVTANLTYSGLTATKNVTVIIFNDTTSSDDKAKAISDSVKNALNNASQSPIDLDTLPVDGITGDNPSAELVMQKISGSLRKAWFNPEATAPTDSSSSTWLIDVVGDVQITITSDGTLANPFYDLDGVSADKKFITGKISNLNISFTYSSPYNKSDVGTGSFKTADLTNAVTAIKIQQSTGSDMQNQLRNAISPKTIMLSFQDMTSKPSADPTATEDWTAYSTAQTSIATALNNIIFQGDINGNTTTSGIHSVYTDTKMPNIIEAANFTVTSSSKFNIKTVGSGIGYFTVTFKLEYTINSTPITINSNSFDIYINSNVKS